MGGVVKMVASEAMTTAARMAAGGVTVHHFMDQSKIKVIILVSTGRDAAVRKV